MQEKIDRQQKKDHEIQNELLIKQLLEEDERMEKDKLINKKVMESENVLVAQKLHQDMDEELREKRAEEEEKNKPE